MFCIYCGQKLRDGARFCTSCGKPTGVGETTDDASNDVPEAESTAEPLDEGAESQKETSLLTDEVPRPNFEHAEETAARATDDEESEQPTTVTDWVTDKQPTVVEPANMMGMGPEGAEERDATAHESAASDQPTGAIGVVSDFVAGPDDATTVLDDAAAGNAPAVATSAVDESAEDGSRMDGLDVMPGTFGAPGAPVDADGAYPGATSASGATMPGDQFAVAPQEPQRKKRRALPFVLAGVGVLAVVLVAVVLLLFNPFAPAGVSFGQDQPVEFSRVTRVRPKDADGDYLSSYRVRLLARQDDGSDQEDNDALDYEIQVSGTGGFTMQDFGDVPDGSYTMVVIDGADGSEQRLPVHYVENNPEAQDTVDIDTPKPDDADGSSSDSKKPAQDGGDAAQRIANRLYLDICNKIIDAHGEPSVHEESQGFTAAQGLALARLIDFDGDGLDELLVVYTDAIPDDASFNPSQGTYHAEVWSYDGEQAVCVWRHDPMNSNGGAFYMLTYERDGKTYLASIEYATSDADETLETTTIWGFDGECFASAAQQVVTFGSGNPAGATSYTIDGSMVDEQTYRDQTADFTMNGAYNLAIFSEGDMPYVQIGDTVQPGDLDPLDPKDLIDATNDTLEDLESNAADPDEAPDPVAYTYELREEPLSIASSQGEGLDFTVDQTWAYPVFTRADGSTDAVLDAINANLKQSYDDDLEAAQSWTMDAGYDQVWLHRDEVTWMDGSIVCIRSDRSTFAGGAHGFESSTAAFVDLASGQTFDVTQACGISLLELQAEATSAIETYAAQTGLDPSFSSDGVGSIVSDLSRYYATDQGIAICIWPYEIGSYADGQHDVYVHAFADPAIVGTSAR